MQYRKDAVQEGCSTGRMQYRTQDRKEFRTGVMQDRCNGGKYGFRIGGMQSVGCRTGGMQDWQNAGKKGCRKGGIQEKSRKIGKQERVEIWTRGIQERGNLGKEGYRKGGMHEGRNQDRRYTGKEGSGTGGV